MNFKLSAEQERWRNDVIDFLENELPVEHRRSTEFDDSDEHWRFALDFTKRVGAMGWLGLTWPAQWGGLDRTRFDLAILREEFEYRSAPLVNAVGHNLVASSLLNFGSEQQKARWLPGILDTTTIWVEGLSEPEAGSDLAALKTRAQQRDRRWLITGQKTYVSWGHRGDFIYLAARTDPDSTGYRGVSIFGVDLHQPGITVHAMPNIAGGRQNHIFFDEVPVSSEHLIGNLHEGWRCIMSVIYSGAGDPMVSIGRLRRIFDLVVARMATTGSSGSRALNDPRVRDILAEAAVEIDALSLLRWEDIWRAENGLPVRYGGALAGLLYREFAPRFAQTCLELAGPAAFTLSEQDELCELSRYFLESLGNHGGGTPQLKRVQIATRELKLPR